MPDAEQGIHDSRVPRLDRWQSWLTIAAAIVLVLVLINMALFELNRALQTEINARQQFLQQSVQLKGLNRDIVTAIANLAVRNKDDQLKAMLSQHGITINVGATGAAPPPIRPLGSPAPGRKSAIGGRRGAARTQNGALGTQPRLN